MYTKFRIMNISNPKPHLFEENKSQNKAKIGKDFKWQQASEATIEEGIKIIKEAKKIREDAQKQFNNATLCF